MSDQTPADQQANQKSAPKSPPLSASEEWSEFIKTAMIAVVLALLIRTFLYEPFNIPSGSMKPTLEVGDYLFVSKPAYGYSRYSFPFGLAPIEGRVWAKAPERGDVAVFKLPTNPRIDYIKRIVGMPGDTVQVIDGRLYINRQIVPRESVGLKRVDEDGSIVVMTEYLETLPNGVVHSIYEEGDDHPLDNTPEYTVPDGHYFAMGDNRDNSQDSRVMNHVGFIPYENIVGRASFLFFSTNGSASLAEVWKWPGAIRYSRLLMSVEPVKVEAPAAASTPVAAD
ncbi:signal peptidase I [Micavibrio aeruginosavorus]|uniref:Signal peptidase I n=1 Tax=Micavibrio aeruginosavorus (strain ARL-13) TaxID=856793 RepID=G2KS48_MICAA|nr:signal peptidase I [Micavibrio aeruginosavorus]AEP10556.1 signal peptidase I [Micavibrio aeruginosavorus ARL-13]